MYLELPTKCPHTLAVSLRCTPWLWTREKWEQQRLPANFTPPRAEPKMLVRRAVVARNIDFANGGCGASSQSTATDHVYIFLQEAKCFQFSVVYLWALTVYHSGLIYTSGYPFNSTHKKINID